MCLPGFIRHKIDQILPFDAAVNTLGDLGSLLFEKLKQLLHRLESLPRFIHDKIDQILPVDAAANTLGRLLLEKPKELLRGLESLSGFIHDKARSADLHRCLAFALTVVLPVALSLFCFYHFCNFCCCCCCMRHLAGIGVKMMKSLGGICKYCCCCIRGQLAGIGVKMMKAPGRMGMVILRAPFEAHPRGYFIILRASSKLLR